MSVTPKPIIFQCQVNNKIVPFEVDTGSCLSTINVNELHDMIDAEIVPTTKRAKGYGDGNVNINFLGAVNLQFVYKDSKVNHLFYVVNGSNNNLLGRDLCSKLNFSLSVPSDDINQINSIHDNLLNKHKDYLSENFKSNVTAKVSLDIDPDKRSIFCKARSVPVRYRVLVKNELDRLSKHGIISKIFRSRWACPTVNVLKSDGTIRICGDYSCTVNQVMPVVKYPLPSIEEVLSTIGESKVFSKIDLQNAYLQLPLDDKSKEYTVINTSEGLYCYNYLPFGLASSPAIFQSFLCQVLSGIDQIIIYQDDILVMTNTDAEHVQVLDKVLTTLRAAGVKLNSKKCSFYVNNVTYLGYVFDKDGIHPSKEKVRAIIDAPIPKDVSQVKSFVGMCTFYNRFIPNFSKVFAPLYKLLKKNSKFQWGKEQNKCVSKIKNLFKSDKVLKLFNPKLETALETDASSYGLGVAVLQRHADGWYPVQFASRTLSDAERNYSQIEREALSVIFGCERFRKFLLGSQFTIKNDHKPLMKLFANNSSVPTNCSARLQRWALRLSQFQYVFEYTKGSENVNSDFLSRMPLSETVTEVEPYELIFVVKSLNDMPITCSDVKSHTDADKSLRMLKEYIKIGFPTIVDPKLNQFKKLEGELSLMKGCIMYRNRVYVPESLRSKILDQFHSGHPGICAMKSLVRSLIWYPGIDSDVTSLVKNCKQCQQALSKPAQNKSIEWPTPHRKWSRLHIDHFFVENKICLVVIDALTKYIECEVVKNTGACETVETLRLIFSRNGLPDTIVSDNATSFTAAEFQQFVLDNGI